MGQRVWTPPPPGKSQVAKGFFTNWIPLEKQLDQVQLLLERGPYGPLGKMLMTKKSCQDPFVGFFLDPCMFSQNGQYFLEVLLS